MVPYALMFASSLEFIVDFVGTICSLFLLCKFSNRFWSIFCRFSFWVNWYFFNFWSNNFQSKFIALKLRIIVDENTLQTISIIFYCENSIAFPLSRNKVTSIYETIFNKNTLSIWNASVKISFKSTSILVLNLALTMRLIVFKNSFYHILIFKTKFSVSMS